MANTKSCEAAQVGRIDPPSHLSPASAALWQAFVPSEAKSTQRLTLLVHALEALDRANDCRRQLATTGLTIKALSGGQRAHPLIAIEAQARKEFRAAWDALGFRTGLAESPYANDAKKASCSTGLPDAYYRHGG